MRLFFIVVLGVAAAADLKSDLNALVETERGFARLSVAKGMTAAFLANLAEDSIVFRPGATPGRAWFQNNPPATAQLDWAPEFADISGAGDFGYTTGPWEIRRKAGEPPAGFGHYVTVWKKQANGVWKVAIDIGIGHAAAPKPSSVRNPPLKSQIEKARSENEIRQARAALLDAERRFPANAATYPAVLSQDARLYRNESFPFVGVSSIRTALSQRKETYSWKPADASVSVSADLGYVYGMVEVKPADAAKPTQTMNYLRIWKKENGRDWKVVLDLLSQ